MRNQLVYDLPTRLFHWLFFGLFLAGFIIAKTIDGDSPVFSIHMLLGLILGFVVLLRLVWGFLGSKHAKFSDFSLNPKDLVSYFFGIFTGSKKRWSGHNPASSWAALLMMLMALGLAVTGYLMTSGSNKEDFEDLHELFSDGFVIVAILHVAGVVFDTIRHKELTGLSMVDGRKSQVPVGEEIAAQSSSVGVLFLGLVVAFGLYLYKGYDAQSGRLNFFGSQLQLGEVQEANDED